MSRNRKAQKAREHRRWCIEQLVKQRPALGNPKPAKAPKGGWNGNTGFAWAVSAFK